MVMGFVPWGFWRARKWGRRRRRRQRRSRRAMRERAIEENRRSETTPPPPPPPLPLRSAMDLSPYSGPRLSRNPPLLPPVHSGAFFMARPCVCRCFRRSRFADLRVVRPIPHAIGIGLVLRAILLGDLGLWLGLALEIPFYLTCICLFLPCSVADSRPWDHGCDAV